MIDIQDQSKSHKANICPLYGVYTDVTAKCKKTTQQTIYCIRTKKRQMTANAQILRQ